MRKMRYSRPLIVKSEGIDDMHAAKAKMTRALDNAESPIETIPPTDVIRNLQKDDADTLILRGLFLLGIEMLAEIEDALRSLPFMTS